MKNKAWYQKMEELIGVNYKWSKTFLASDPFNNNNMLEGLISLHPDYRYGAMIIFRINNKDVEPQIIYGTPKMHYPFDVTQNFHWGNLTVKEVQCYDKLDGSNILCFSYKDSENNICHTYKTRLGPVIGNSKYGNFYSMWCEMLEKNKWISDVIEKNQEYNLSFELYGFRNQITIPYKVPLDVKLLFGVNKKTGELKPPVELNLSEDAAIPEYIKGDSANPTEFYKKLRQKLTDDNVNSLSQFNQLSNEGMVFYIKSSENKWVLFKCKTEQIEKFHWSIARTIGITELWNTAINSFEEQEPDLNYFIELLKEEYPLQLIEKQMEKIKNTFQKALEYKTRLQRINEVWHMSKKQGFDIMKDKAATFRFISKYFTKKEMSYVANFILTQIDFYNRTL